MNPSVLIVGAGPVGLTLACELTRYKVPVRIVDKAPQRTDKSKALVLWSRTLELLDRGDTGAAPFVDWDSRSTASISWRRIAAWSVTSKWSPCRAPTITR
jgi:2-polyprenyl-6-methoxyphenol hydroxylase-like FAD-dependent oxidoreductase